jgi:ribosomal protein S27AE
MKNNKRDFCPRCGSKNLRIFEDRVWCKGCDLEYYKEDFYQMPGDELLSIQEMLRITKLFPKLSSRSDTEF